MKNLMLILCAVMGLSTAQASQTSLTGKALFNVNTNSWSAVRLNSETQPPEDDPMKPIRQADAKVSMIKWTYTVQPDGTYQYAESTVCIEHPKVDVFDARLSQGWFLKLNPISCDSVYRNRQVKVIAFTYVMLMKAKLHPDEAETEAKYNGAWANISEDIPNGTVSEFIEGSGSLSREMGKTSTFVPIRQSDGYICTQPIPTEPEPIPSPIIPNKSITDGGGSNTPPTQCAPTRTEGFRINIEVTDTP